MDIIYLIFFYRSEQRPHRSHNSTSNNLAPANSGSASKKPRLDAKSSNGSSFNSLPSTSTTTTVTDSGSFDHSNSDHVVAMTQLKEQLDNMKKQLRQKDNELLTKDKMVSYCNLLQLN